MIGNTVQLNWIERNIVFQNQSQFADKLFPDCHNRLVSITYSMIESMDNSWGKSFHFDLLCSLSLKNSEEKNISSAVNSAKHSFDRSIDGSGQGDSADLMNFWKTGFCTFETKYFDHSLMPSPTVFKMNAEKVQEDAVVHKINGQVRIRNNKNLRFPKFIQILLCGVLCDIHVWGVVFKTRFPMVSNDAILRT